MLSIAIFKKILSKKQEKYLAIANTILALQLIYSLDRCLSSTIVHVQRLMEGHWLAYYRMVKYL